MFKVIQVGAGEVDRFIEVKDDDGRKFQIFDYSASTVMKIEDSFQIEVGRYYKMKLELFGELIDKDENKNFGKNIEFNIIKKQMIGKVEFYLVSTEMGDFYIRNETPIDKMLKNGLRNGWYNFTRIDLIQLDDKIQPELK